MLIIVVLLNALLQCSDSGAFALLLVFYVLIVSSMSAASKQLIFDVMIIGAGAAGMMCAARLGAQGISVLLIDHAVKIGEKIRISGGGRCNFTNLALIDQDPAPFFVSRQPRFVRHALARYTARDFMDLLDQYHVPYHEKHAGQMFCDRSAKDVIFVLQQECKRAGVQWQTACQIQSVEVFSSESPTRFLIRSNTGKYRGRKLVVATGGLAAPAIGASGLGYEIGKQTGHEIVPPKAALVPLRFESWAKNGFDALAGISLPVRIGTPHGKKSIQFDEDLLFRHGGLSGPAILQISSYWKKGQHIHIDLCPDVDLAQRLCTEKSGQKIQLDTAIMQLAPQLPKRLLRFFLTQEKFSVFSRQPWANTPNTILRALGEQLNEWSLLPCGDYGHKKAEATRGGIATCELDAKTMASRLHPDLYFIGEVIDVTGWLGGYNLQWAWSSAVCAARAIGQEILST